jgi:hypothetical protein
MGNQQMGECNSKQMKGGEASHRSKDEEIEREKKKWMRLVEEPPTGLIK